MFQGSDNFGKTIKISVRKPFMFAVQLGYARDLFTLPFSIYDFLMEDCAPVYVKKENISLSEAKQSLRISHIKTCLFFGAIGFGAAITLSALIWGNALAFGAPLITLYAGIGCLIGTWLSALSSIGRFSEKDSEVSSLKEHIETPSMKYVMRCFKHSIHAKSMKSIYEEADGISFRTYIPTLSIFEKIIEPSTDFKTFGDNIYNIIDIDDCDSGGDVLAAVKTIYLEYWYNFSKDRLKKDISFNFV